MGVVSCKTLRSCQEWDSNPRLQGRLRPERSALDRSAILTAGLVTLRLTWLRPYANICALHPTSLWRSGCRGAQRTGRARGPVGSKDSRLAWLGRPRPLAPPGRGTTRAYLLCLAARLPSRASPSPRGARVEGHRQRALGVFSSTRVGVGLRLAVRLLRWQTR